MRACRLTVGGLVLILATGMTVSGAAWAEKVYKWVDAEGVTHYGEAAPKDTTATKVKVSDTTSSDVDVEMERLDKTRVAAKAARERAAEETSPGTAPDSGVAEANKKACDMHRKNLAVLKTGTRIRVTEGSGQPRVLSEEERKAQLELAEGELKRCEQLEKVRVAREGGAK